ncbi:LacI family DNA-binding transcriptional regulator [Isoptericola sp. NPDC056605]|uniref:LacI family DNA-binding transcriptional regulator n=1 Tax=Isoptericola sp. NPDC056605 TaxID=3345876 RepID=UPI003699CCD8
MTDAGGQATRPRSRRPSMADVAAVAGVSHQTVSRVLNEHPSVRGETRERVLDAIATLGYRRNSAARALATARSATLGVVTTGSALFGPTSTLIAIEGAARDQGYFVSVATLRSYDAAAMHEALEHFMDQGVEAIVVIAPQDDVAAAVESFRAPVPVLVVAALQKLPRDVGTTAAGPTTLSLAVDQRAGARAATDHLLGLGHHDVLHVAGPQDWFDARERAAGWREALEARGIAPSRPRYCSWSAEDGYTAGRDLAEAVVAHEGPTAVFAGNDQLALGILRAFWERGLSVPDDVSVVGFDDVAGAAYFVPPLTTVRQPFGVLGERSVAMVVAALAGGSVPTERIVPELVVRSSTAPPPAR